MIQSEYKNMFESENSYWWYVTLHQITEIFVKKTRKGKNINIFDAGCGTGRMLEILKKYGNVEGIDFSEEAVIFSKQRGLKNVCFGDLNDREFKTDKYDYIISADVICHNGVKDDNEVISKFYKALVPGGFLLMNLPAFNILKRRHDKAVFIKRRYTRKKLKTQLKKQGFTIYRSTYRLPLLFPVLLLKKLIENILKKDKIESDLKSLPVWLNKFLIFIMKIENFKISLGINIPFGSSIFVVAEK